MKCNEFHSKYGKTRDEHNKNQMLYHKSSSFTTEHYYFNHSDFNSNVHIYRWHLTFLFDYRDLKYYNSKYLCVLFNALFSSVARLTLFFRQLFIYLILSSP